MLGISLTTTTPPSVVLRRLIERLYDEMQCQTKCCEYKARTFYSRGLRVSNANLQSASDDGSHQVTGPLQARKATPSIMHLEHIRVDASQLSEAYADAIVKVESQTKASRTPDAKLGKEEEALNWS